MRLHYETKHSSFEQSCPLKFEPRAGKITELQAQHDRSNRVITHIFTAQQHANGCSLKVSWIVGQHTKPVGRFWRSAHTLLLRHCLRKTKSVSFNSNQKIRNISKWCTGAAWCSYLGIYLAIDKYTDVTDNAQLLVYVKFFTKITWTIGFQFFRLRSL